MPTPVAWSPSFGFNFRLADSQTQLRFVQLRDGTYWVVWTDNRDTGAGSPIGTDLVGQRYDAFGLAISGEVRLNALSDSNERNAHLAADVDSNDFFIVYEDQNAGGGIDIVLEARTPLGNPAGTLVIALDPTNDTTGINFRNPRVAVASATSGLVVFERTDNAGNTDIYGQRFNPNTGGLLGSAFIIADRVFSAQDPQITVTSDGRYAVVWKAGDVEGVFVDQAGVLTGSFTANAAGQPGNEPSVVALSNGGVVVSWRFDGVSLKEVIAVEVHSSGALNGSRISIAVTSSTIGSHQIVANGPASFVLAWENAANGEVRLSAHNVAGGSISLSGSQIPAANAGSVSALALLALADGRVLLGYDAPLGVAQIWDPRANANASAVYTPTDMQIGTPGNDVFTAASGADIVHGWDGNDDITDGPGVEAQYFGGNGNDTIRFNFVDPSDGAADGGPGNDTLVYLALAGPTTINLAAGTATTGALTQSVINFENFTASSSIVQDINVTAGAALSNLTTAGGNDTLDLGVGRGVMTGGAGNDTYMVDFLDDNVVEQTVGGGTDTVMTALTNYTLPLNVEILLYTGSAAATLRGNTGFNTVTGGPLADLILLQDGGADSAIGGGGNDGFYFGANYSSADSVDGGAGTLDQIGLQGNYDTGPVTLGPLIGVELVVLLPGNDPRFGGQTGTLLSYDLVTTDANTAAGQVLTFQANTLRSGEAFRLNASAETDGLILTFGGLGTDTITGGQQGDGFYFGTARFNLGDSVNGQGGSDQLGLQGNFSGANALTFGAGQLTNMEFIVLLSASDTRFGGGSVGQNFSYTITMNNGNVAAGQQMIIQANGLLETEVLTFNGSAEIDGTFRVFGGRGDDTITGGVGADDLNGNPGADRVEGRGGADILRGGTGSDLFIYLATSESTPGVRDAIMDFATGDRIDLSLVDANSVLAGSQAFELIANGAAFTGAGQLRITQTGNNAMIEGDSNGDLAADFAISVTVVDGHALGLADFIGVTDNQPAEPLFDPKGIDESWQWKSRFDLGIEPQLMPTSDLLT